MNLALFHFIRPYWLLALIPLLIITRLLFKHKLQSGNWINVCDEALLPYILQKKPIKQSRLSLVGLSLASLLTIFSLAGPTWERIPSPAFRNDSGLVIALDLSRSMEAADIKPSRLIRARYKIEDILKARKDGQTALLVYAGDAFTVTPLTNDNATIASQLQALSPDIMPSAGSNMTLAVEKAIALLKQAGLQKGMILVITDSVNEGETATVLQNLGNYQLSVFAIGTEQGAPISLPAGGFLKDESGTIVVPKLPTRELQQLAGNGNGIYQVITDDDSDIKNVLEAVGKSVGKAIDSDGKNSLLLEKWDEKGVWLILLILPLAALSFRRGLLIFAFLCILPVSKNSYALEWQDLWQTKNQQAQQAFNHGDYDKAAQLFENPEWQAAALYKSKQPELKALKTQNSTTGFYNQGNVLAKLGKYEEAIKAYEQALKLDPHNEDAKYNKKLVEDALKKQQQQQQQNQNQDSQDKQDKKQNQDSQRSLHEKQESSDNKDGQENKDKEQQKLDQNSQNAQNTKNQPQNQESQQKSAQKQNTPNQNAQDNKPAEQQAVKSDKQLSKKSDQNTQVQQTHALQNEKNQANEQWLNRIPDDPAGLLRRKFQYQYSQQQRQSENNSQAW